MWVRAFFALTGLALLSTPASAVTIDWVLVGDPGNPADTPANCGMENCGSVPYAFYISKYEVTNAQYAEFLNAKAANDPYGLYSTSMGSHELGGITRSGSDGSYTYSVKPGVEDKPVNFVDWADARRFANWLNNGQGNGLLNSGAYTMTASSTRPTRNPDAIVFLPNENEWYKAAYYDAVSATYFDYPTGTDVQTVCAMPGATPDTANCGSVVGALTDVGAYTGSPSPYGTFDQGGNVVEWNENTFGIAISGVGARGGWYSSEAYTLAAYQPFAWFSATAYTGFRVAMVVPEPGTIALVLMGLTGLFAKRRWS